MGVFAWLASAVLLALQPFDALRAVPSIVEGQQAAAPASPPTVPAGTARISGIVKSAADEKPIARARVLAVSSVLPEPRAVLTGSDGRYSIADLPAGAYTVTAVRTGYASQTYGQGRSATGTPITVTSTQQVTAIDFPLEAGGVIAGRILDEDGAPFAGATVEALISRVQAGTDMLFSVSTAQTDDRGEFRLFALPPGSYYVSASDPAFTAVSTPKGVQHYSATYYPGTAQADQAKTIVVTGAGEPPRVEFRLRLVPPARVAGQLTAFDARQLLSGAIIMSPLEGEGVPMVAPEDPQIFPDGRFVFNGVQPGRYQIRARGQTDAETAALFATYQIDVAGTDVDGIRMMLRPGALVDGTLTAEAKHGTKPPVFSTLRVRAPFTDGNVFGDSLTGIVQVNGTYALRGVMKGVHQIVVDGLERPWHVKRVTKRGTDITDLQIETSEREIIRDVRIVISDAGSEVTGTVRNSRNLPVANTGVLVFSKAPLFWLRTSRRMRMTYTDYEGRWSLYGLPAGEYVAVASPMLDESDLGRNDRLRTLMTIGTSFRLPTDEATATLDLKIVPTVPPVSR